MNGEDHVDMAGVYDLDLLAAGRNEPIELSTLFCAQRSSDYSVTVQVHVHAMGITTAKITFTCSKHYGEFGAREGQRSLEKFNEDFVKPMFPKMFCVFLSADRDPAKGVRLEWCSKHIRSVIQPLINGGLCNDW